MAAAEAAQYAEQLQKATDDLKAKTRECEDLQVQLDRQCSKGEAAAAEAAEAAQTSAEDLSAVSHPRHFNPVCCDGIDFRHVPGLFRIQELQRGEDGCSQWIVPVCVHMKSCMYETWELSRRYREASCGSSRRNEHAMLTPLRISKLLGIFRRNCRLTLS